jgi:ribonuclease BN (tRNA processing enzyme)
MNEQKKIRYVLLSHIHADHIKGLPFLSENLIGQKGQKPVVIISLEKVLTGLHRNLFNNKIWPDFTKIPTEKKPIFRLKPIREGETLQVEGFQVKAFRVNHTVPCAGFLVQQKNTSLLYSGDTYKTHKIWKAASTTKNLKAAMIETSFPNSMEGLAKASKHLTPSLLSQEFSKIGKLHLPLFIYHMKPRYLKTIQKELKNLGLKKLVMLKDGVVFNI